MIIQWIGHSSFRIRGSKTIITDPYEGIGLVFPELKADIVTVSHGHHDHNAVQMVAGEPAVVADAGIRRVGNVSVAGYNTYHDEEKGAKRGRNVVYVINMDGIKIAHLGDLGCMPDDSILGAITGVDVLLIPVGGNYTIDGKTAAKIVAEVKPRTVIPMHYKTPGLQVNVSGNEEFLALMENVQQVEGSRLELTPLTGKVVVFEKPLGEK